MRGEATNENTHLILLKEMKYMPQSYLYHIYIFLKKVQKFI